MADFNARPGYTLDAFTGTTKTMTMEKKKRPTGTIAPVACTKEEQDQLYRIAEQRGMSFSGMVKYDYLKVKPVTAVKTPLQNLMTNVHTELSIMNDRLEQNAEDDPALQKLHSEIYYYLQTMSFQIVQMATKKK